MFPIFPVVLASPGALEALPVANPAWALECTEDDQWCGTALSGVGDQDGDGLEEFLVGASQAPLHGEVRGSVSVFAGAEPAPSSAPAWILYGSQRGARFGYAAIGRGDADGDGLPDLVASSYYYDHGTSARGTIEVYYGNGTLDAPTRSTLLLPPDDARQYFGENVAGLGDCNGDGLQDLAASDTGYEVEFDEQGRAYAWLGAPGGFAEAPDWLVPGEAAHGWFGYDLTWAGDPNADGYDDLLVGAGTDGTDGAGPEAAHLFFGTAAGLETSPGWTVSVEGSDTFFGISVGAPGDVNGDGFADVLVGAPLWDATVTDAGAAFLYFGSASGPEPEASWSWEPATPEWWMGWTLEGLGDLDGDGFVDFLVGGGRVSWPAGPPGGAFVFHGGPDGPDTRPALAARATEETAEYFGRRAANAGDVNGDGRPDFLVSDYSCCRNAGVAYLYLGPSAGVDGDGDGHGPTSLGGGDCDDADPALHPGATETCDGRDEDCDGVVDQASTGEPPKGAQTSWPDADEDGWGDPAGETTTCGVPDGNVLVAQDCDDTDGAVHPGAPESCDDRDEDCDGTPDDGASDAPTWYADADGDGHGDAAAPAVACDAPAGHVATADDCDDASAEVSPSADEACGDALDNDCDAATTDTCEQETDADKLDPECGCSGGGQPSGLLAIGAMAVGCRRVRAGRARSTRRSASTS